MPIEDLIQREVQTLPPDATCVDAAQLMAAQGIGTVVVVDDESPLGIVTDRDLVVRVIARGEKSETVTLREVMTDELIFLEGDRSIDTAIRTLRDQGIRRLVVADRQGRLEGLISIDDLLALLIAQLTDLSEVVSP